MTLSKLFSRHFESKVRSRGTSYYRYGYVHIKKGTDVSVEAIVEGSRDYKVNLILEDKRLGINCSCPYFQDREEPCKHIWATFLATESQGYLKTVIAKRISSLNYGNDDYDDETDDFSDEDELKDVFQEVLSPPSLNQYVPQRRGPDWQDNFSLLLNTMKTERIEERKKWPKDTEIIYIIDVPATLSNGGLAIEIAWHQKKQNGEWSKLKTTGFYDYQIATMSDPEDREIITLLKGAKGDEGYSTYISSYLPFRFRLSYQIASILIPRMCRTGRCRLRLVQGEKENLQNINWDDGVPWEFCLEIRPDKPACQSPDKIGAVGRDTRCYLIKGSLRRRAEQMDLAHPFLLYAGGLVFYDNYVARLNDFNAFGWISLLRKQRTIHVPISEREKLLDKLVQLPYQPHLELPTELQYEKIKVSPQFKLIVKKAKRYLSSEEMLHGDLSLNYLEKTVPGEDFSAGIFDHVQRRLILRDINAEFAAEELLKQVGFRYLYAYDSNRRLDRYVYEIKPAKFSKAVKVLLEKGWRVEAEGKLYRKPGNVCISVNTGIDWFELHGAVDFGGQKVGFPQLLASLKKGENLVQLGDGSFGMLPEEWLKKYGLLTGMGRVHDDHLRFAKTQVCLLDALLSAQPNVTCDELFSCTRKELLQFEGIKPADPPDSFIGKLREYQRDGLGWLIFLQKFGFGGCLADDMGLGKTIQTLALLETRRHQCLSKPGPSLRPSLVIVPKSLIFNWKQEAERFTPQLKVLDHTGNERLKPGEHFNNYDLVLTTYGTLRRDIVDLKEIHFDYAILDESQAIKNMKTASAKATRLLKCDHRLALSGTPIENHLGELWSLFEFLNPGMLGSSSVFQMNTSSLRNPDEETRKVLSQGLRPFILRRTKNQVAKDLPSKTEQTIYCELESEQRKLYNELLVHYRSSLLDRARREGMNKIKMHVLKALLRLRQAACHPGLLDKARVNEPSAKLESLLEQVSEVVEEGHKVLVFSQFTSFLAIVRKHLAKLEITYEYLDGQTRDRKTPVERFQNEPECKLFLISLKAGGLGLNLTAADYVFLLDPWWNPAVESQAIDRSHRIGQSRQVFAYRLISRQTVEEKVLELQQTKRDLADAIINADNSLIRKLTREDLEMLLS